MVTFMVEEKNDGIMDLRLATGAELASLEGDEFLASMFYSGKVVCIYKQKTGGRKQMLKTEESLAGFLEDLGVECTPPVSLEDASIALWDAYTEEEGEAEECSADIEELQERIMELSTARREALARMRVLDKAYFKLTGYSREG